MLSLEKKSQIEESLTQTKTIDEIFDFLKEEAKKTVNCDGIVIYLLEENQYLNLSYIHLPKNLKQTESIYLHSRVHYSLHPHLTECIENNKILNIHKRSLAEDSYIRQRFELWDIEQAYYFPIGKKSEKNLGILQIFNNKKKFSIDTELTIQLLLDIFYYPAAILLQEENIRKKKDEAIIIREKYKQLLSISANLNKIESFHKLYRILIEQFISFFNFDLGFIQIVNNNKLITIDGYSSHPDYEFIIQQQIDYFQNFENAPSLNPHEPSQTLACEAFFNNSPYYISDVQAIQRVKMREKDRIALEMTDKQLKSILIIPIADQTQSIGVLQLWNFSHEIKLGEIDIEMITNICSFIPSILKNRELYAVIEKQNTQIKNEMILARNIQKNLLPSQFPNLGKVNFASLYEPMEEIGGDLYDFIRLRERELIGIFISDISGHGVPSALITSMVKIILDNSGGHKLDPVGLFTYLNEKLQDKTSEYYLTAFYGVYNIDTKIFKYARAAHPYPIIIRKKELIYLNGKGSILGIFEKIKLEEKEFKLEKDDKVIFYTDGLTDVRNNAHIKFEKIFAEVLLKHHALPIKELIQNIYHELIAFSTTKKNMSDDICILGMEVLE